MRTLEELLLQLGLGDLDLDGLVNLLGMSFLSRVRWTYERGKLVLEQ